MKKFLFTASLLMLSVPGHARLNILEPWSPGVDVRTPEKLWTHGANVRLGASDPDVFEAAYFLNHRAGSNWEVGGTLGYLSVDPEGPINRHSGVNDLAFAAKYEFPGAAGPYAMRAAGEAGISLPTGDSDHALGAGGVGFLLGWGLETAVQAVTGYIHLGSRFYTEGNDTKLGNVFTYTVGAKYKLQTDFWMTMDLRGFNHGKDKFNGVRASESVQELYLVPGTLYRAVNLPIDIQASLLLGLTNESMDVGLLAGFKF